MLRDNLILTVPESKQSVSSSFHWPCKERRHDGNIFARQSPYIDRITQSSNSDVRRKNIDYEMLAGECSICLRAWQIEEEDALQEREFEDAEEREQRSL